MKVEDIIGLNILDVLCEKFSNASTGFSTVMFKLTDCYLEFMVEESTDEIIAQIKSEIDEMKFYTPSWANTIKTKKLSQFWGIENDKGYSDLICLGFHCCPIKIAKSSLTYLIIS